jgi:sigma-B regulation protein RsbU (phosphoserine phosphatase)
MPTKEVFYLRSLEMFNSIISKIPMKISVPLLLTAPVIAVVIILSVIAYVEGQSTANELMAQNLAQIHEHIEKRLKNFLNLPKQIQQLNANLIGEGLINLKNLRSWRKVLLEQVQAFDGLSRITWGSVDGHSVGISRKPDGTGYEFAIKDEQTGQDIQKFNCDQMGRMDIKPAGIFPYDPRDRLWYKSVINGHKSTWNNPYALEREGDPGVTLALGYSQPFSDKQGQIVGVMNAELTLNDITLFLERLSIGKTGKAFLIDHRGRLIATSTGVPVTDIGNYPVIASASADRQVSAAARKIEEAFDSFKDIVARYQLKLRISGRPYLLMTSPYEYEAGLTWIISTLVPESDFLAELKAGRQRSIKIGVIAVLISLLLGVVLAALSLRPMLDLVNHVKRIGQGNYEHELTLAYSTEFIQLSKEINAMTAGLRDRMQLRHSLALAQEVQQNLLPSDTPKIDGLDIASSSTYCDETGGDYFDFLKISGLPPTTVAIAVGDVVGHGVAAAMLMATARGILRSRCQRPGTLADLLIHLNNFLVEDTGDGQFMTMLLMTVDARLKEMRWATAGHDAPIVYDPVTGTDVELKSRNVSLGIQKDINYSEQCYHKVTSGQIYMALTDGLYESFNKDGQMFGKERVHNLIKQNAHQSAAAIGQKIEEELIRFRGESSIEDDYTFVITKVL